MLPVCVPKHITRGSLQRGAPIVNTFNMQASDGESRETIFSYYIYIHLYIFNMSLCHFVQDCHFKWRFGFTPELDASGSGGLQGSCNFYAELPERSELAWGDFSPLHKAGMSDSHSKGHCF